MIPKKENGKLSEYGEERCNSHDGFARAHLSHIREQIGRSTQSAETAKKRREQEQNPSPACEEITYSTTGIRLRLLRDRMCQLLRDEEIDKHQHAEAPEGD